MHAVALLLLRLGLGVQGDRQAVRLERSDGLGVRCEGCCCCRLDSAGHACAQLAPLGAQGVPCVSCQVAGLVPPCCRQVRHLFRRAPECLQGLIQDDLLAVTQACEMLGREDVHPGRWVVLDTCHLLVVCMALDECNPQLPVSLLLDPDQVADKAAEGRHDGQQQEEGSPPPLLACKATASSSKGPALRQW